jgi:hypothetical protein
MAGQQRRASQNTQGDRFHQAFLHKSILVPKEYDVLLLISRNSSVVPVMTDFRKPRQGFAPLIFAISIMHFR